MTRRQAARRRALWRGSSIGTAIGALALLAALVVPQILDGLWTVEQPITTYQR